VAPPQGRRSRPRTASRYLLNFEAAGELGVSPDQVEGVLVAIAPVVGGAAIAAAAGSITRALGVAIELGELADEADASS
jgi:hypothetical protein